MNTLRIISIVGAIVSFTLLALMAFCIIDQQRPPLPRRGTAANIALCICPFFCAFLYCVWEENPSFTHRWLPIFLLGIFGSTFVFCVFEIYDLISKNTYTIIKFNIETQEEVFENVSGRAIRPYKEAERKQGIVDDEYFKEQRVFRKKIILYSVIGGIIAVTSLVLGTLLYLNII